MEPLEILLDTYIWPVLIVLMFFIIIIIVLNLD